MSSASDRILHPNPAEIDLRAVPLWGFEDSQNPTNIKSMVGAIAVGDVFPRVPVIFSEGEGYFLTPTIERIEGMPDGGHHRAIAHYLASAPLRVLVYPNYGIPYTRSMQVAVSELAAIHESSIKRV